MKRYLALLALLIVSAHAWGALTWMPASRLSTYCNSSLPDERNICSAYVAGIAEVVTNEDYKGYRACIPWGADVLQLAAVIKKYLNDHPEELHYNGAGIVAKALGLAFPCP
jgi:hypothetical protein